MSDISASPSVDTAGEGPRSTFPSEQLICCSDKVTMYIVLQRIYNAEYATGQCNRMVIYFIEKKRVLRDPWDCGAYLRLMRGIPVRVHLVAVVVTVSIHNVLAIR